ncbi:MAG: hypothetical protein ABMA13_05515 [Chthoniobacteraceae bacterium]
MIFVLMIGQSALCMAQQHADVSSLAGTWVIRFSNGVDRVYKIAADGSFSFVDASESKSGVIKVRDGQLLAELTDRIHRFSKLSETLLKVESFNPKNRFASNKPSSVGTGLLEAAAGARTPVANSQTPRLTATPRPSPSTPTPAQQPLPSASAKTIKLKTGWDSPMQGGSKTHQDLAMVLNGFGKADPNPPFADIELYNGVKYLMPVNEALAILGLNQRLPSVKKVVCPGLPRDSFNYISFDGLFDGHFNRLDMAIDTDNQVVSIQLVDEHPKGASSYSDEGDWLTFNFIGYRVKAMTYMKIQYQLSEMRLSPGLKSQQKMRWEDLSRFSNGAPSSCRRVNALLRNKEHKLLEETQWYVPKPLADLIMHCISKAQR